MTGIAAINRHLGQIYAAVLALLALALASAGIAFVAGERSAGVGWSLLACVLACATAIGGLTYLRRSVSHRLVQASDAMNQRQRMMDTDLLTGVLGRRPFLGELREMIGDTIQPHAVTLVLVDLDHFKQINDSHGHHVGDRALAHLAQELRRLFPGCAIGRLGGDEFAVAIAGSAADSACARIGELLTALARGLPHEGNRLALSISVGIATSPEHGDDTANLMLHADLALYESKGAGRARATIYDPAMMAEQRHRRLMERELRAAVMMRELELHYQPVAGGNGRILGHEALVRWRHPIRGLISPAEFIPVAERSRLIDMVGEWVFRRACLDLDRLQGSTVSVNISGEQLKRDELLLMVSRVLKETGQDAGRLVLELTETVAMSASPEELLRLEKLRAMGFRVALDDFGTGHCGFNYLRSLPIDIIKIDRSYVASLANDPISQIFVSALCQIARAQKLTIVAEGVETAGELELVRAAGCALFQGWFIGRPAPLPARAETRRRLAA